MLRNWSFFACVASLSVVGVSHASLISLTSSKDNTLYQDPNGALSNGTGEFFFTGNTGAGIVRRGLIAFDLSSIPSGSTINGVSLTLHMSMGSLGATDVSLHRLLADWGEGASDAPGGEGAGIAAATGDATWLHTFFSTGLWANAGGDFDALASATTSVNAVGFYTWSSAQMISDVQQHVNSSVTNFGWLLKGKESGTNTSKRFDTRENAVAEFRPVLVVDYTPLPAPAALLTLVAGARPSNRRRRR